MSKCLKELAIEALMVNRDYTPYSRQRAKLGKVGAKGPPSPHFLSHDALLHPPEETLKIVESPTRLTTPIFAMPQNRKCRRL